MVGRKEGSPEIFSAAALRLIVTYRVKKRIVTNCATALSPPRATATSAIAPLIQVAMVG